MLRSSLRLQLGRGVASALLIVGLSGCLMGPDYERPNVVMNEGWDVRDVNAPLDEDYVSGVVDALSGRHPDHPDADGAVGESRVASRVEPHARGTAFAGDFFGRILSEDRHVGRGAGGAYQRERSASAGVGAGGRVAPVYVWRGARA